MAASGTIKIVSRFGGIQFKETGDMWYNPVDELKDEVISNLKKGMFVKLETDSKRKFDSYEIVNLGEIQEETIEEVPVKEERVEDSPKPVQPYLSKDAFWRNKEIRDIENTKRISRHGAINTAVSILGDLNKDDLSKYKETIEQLADWVLEYVNKEESK